MRNVQRPTYPRLANEGLCSIRGVRYRVNWWSNRTYEFTCVDENGGKHDGKTYTEQQVSEGLKAKRIIKL